MMVRTLITFLMLMTVAGCGQKNESKGSAPTLSRAATPGSANRFLAYQHIIHIDTEEDKVTAVYEAGQAACREAVADLCAILESRITTGRAASASLKFRAKPSGIQKLIAAMSKQGLVTNQSTSAEDLASPIEDAAKKLALLTDYRTRLEGLRGRASNDVDALIKLNRELAQVQSELEATSGQQAHLAQRVETEILSVSIDSGRNQSLLRPIALAISDFGSNLSQAFSIAITTIAYLIPWALVLALIVWAGRVLWHRRKRRSERA
jgi:predicted regulator of amino acid metabolism with ACT domain